MTRIGWLSNRSIPAAVLAAFLAVAPVWALTAEAAPAPQVTTPEQLADALADALERSDYSALERLVTPEGWTAGFYQGEADPRRTPAETIEFLRSRQKGAMLQVAVQRRPLFQRESYQPAGELYLRSTWRDWGLDAVQNVDLMLQRESSGWRWSGALFRSPNAPTVTATAPASPTQTVASTTQAPSPTTAPQLPSTAAASPSPQATPAPDALVLGLGGLLLALVLAAAFAFLGRRGS